MVSTEINETCGGCKKFRQKLYPCKQDLCSETCCIGIANRVKLANQAKAQHKRSRQKVTLTKSSHCLRVMSRSGSTNKKRVKKSHVVGRRFDGCTDRRKPQNAFCAFMKAKIFRSVNTFETMNCSTVVSEKLQIPSHCCRPLSSDRVLCLVSVVVLRVQFLDIVLYKDSNLLLFFLALTVWSRLKSYRNISGY